MKRIYFYCNLFWLLFSLITCVESYRLHVGTIGKPGPGLFPFGAGLIMMLLALIGLFQTMGKTKTIGKPVSAPQEPFRWWNIVIVLVGICAYTLCLEDLGFLITTFLLVTLLLKVVEPQSWKASILGGLITAVAADVVFNVIFQAQIPSGLLGF